MLPKKGSRRVTVEGKVYRWRESYGQQAFELRIEQFETPGQMLVVCFPYRYLDPDHPTRVYRPIMVSRLLRDVIDYGLEHGWSPGIRRPHLFVSLNNAATLVPDDEHYRYCRWTARAR